LQALISGVTGFIGSHLAERLLAEGVAVRGLARRPDEAAWLARRGAEIVTGDLLDRASLAGAAQGCDVVLHAGAWTGGPGPGERQAWIANVAATGWLLHAAQEADVQRFVYFSSVAVYGLNAAPLIDETASTPPVGQLYPDSKIAAETLVRAAQADGLPTTIIRPASTYGPRGAAWTIGPVEQIKAGRLVLLGRDQGLVNTGYIDNVVDGVLLALRNPAAVGETFNLCDGTAITYREFYGRYAAMLGRERLPVYPAWLARGAVSPPGRWLRRLLGKAVPGPWSYHFRFNPSRFSIAKARRLLGYAPAIDLDEGMRRTEQWLGEQGYLGARGR
jgi:nucleoside-diphosphate-sugar epimerase